MRNTTHALPEFWEFDEARQESASTFHRFMAKTIDNCLETGCEATAASGGCVLHSEDFLTLLDTDIDGLIRMARRTAMCDLLAFALTCTALRPLPPFFDGYGTSITVKDWLEHQRRIKAVLLRNMSLPDVCLTALVLNARDADKVRFIETPRFAAMARAHDLHHADHYRLLYALASHFDDEGTDPALVPNVSWTVRAALAPLMPYGMLDRIKSDPDERVRAALMSNRACTQPDYHRGSIDPSALVRAAAAKYTTSHITLGRLSTDSDFNVRLAVWNNCDTYDITIEEMSPEFAEGREHLDPFNPRLDTAGVA